jgi:DNA-binding PadR family transcriptional regulator
MPDIFDEFKFDTGNYLPLTEATYYTMLSLVEPLHGYGIMQKVAEISGGAVRPGPGTMYGVLAMLEKEGLIAREKTAGRRKMFILTLKGRMVLRDQIDRLEVMVKNGRGVRTRL